MHSSVQSSFVSKAQDHKVPFFRSIQGQVMLWMLGLGLVPLIVLGTIAYLSAQDALHRATQDQLATVVENKAAEIEKWLLDTVSIASIYAQLPTIAGDTSSATFMGLEDIVRFRNDAEHTEEYQAAYDAAYDTSRLLGETFDRVEGVFVSGMDGIVLVSSLPEVIPEGADARSLSEATRLTFEEGLKPGGYITDIVVSIDGVTPVFGIGFPVVNPRGQTIGVAALRINATRIAEVLGNTAGMGESGETYLVNTTTGVMLSQSRHIQESTILQQVVDTKPVQQSQSGVVEGSESYLNYLGTPVVGLSRVGI